MTINKIAIIIFGEFTNGKILKNQKEKLFDKLNIDYDVFINVTEKRTYPAINTVNNKCMINELKTNYFDDIEITNELFNIDDYINNKQVTVNFPIEYIKNKYKSIFNEKLKHIEISNPYCTHMVHYTIKSQATIRLNNLYNNIQNYAFENNINYNAIIKFRSDYEILLMDIKTLNIYIEDVINNNIIYMTNNCQSEYRLYSNGKKFNLDSKKNLSFPRLDFFSITKLEYLSKEFYEELWEFTNIENIKKYSNNTIQIYPFYDINYVLNEYNTNLDKNINGRLKNIDHSLLPFFVYKNIQMKFIDFEQILLRRTRYDNLNNYI